MKNPFGYAWTLATHTRDLTPAEIVQGAKDFWSTGTYRELVAPERLVCSDSFADERGKIVPASAYGMDGNWPLELLVTVTFTEEGGETVQTLRHSGPRRVRCAMGWNESFDKLATLLEGTQGAS